MADRQRRSRYLTISILHIITIMCQGMEYILMYFNIVEFKRETFFIIQLSQGHNITTLQYNVIKSAVRHKCSNISLRFQ